MKRINDEETKFSVDVKYTNGQNVCSPLPEVKTKGEAVIYAKTRAAYEQNVEYVELLYLDKNGNLKPINKIYKLHDSCNKNTNDMKRIKDSTIPDEWFMNGKAPLLNEPDSQNDTLWKVVLWSGSGYAADPYLFYAPKDFSEWQFEVLVAALDKNGITDYYEDDYYWNNPDIDEELEQSNFEDVDDLMDAYNDIYVDGTMEGANKPHVLRGENLKIEPADEPIEYYMGETVSDSRRVKDSEDNEFEYHVSIFDSAEMSKEEGRKYEEELCALLSNKRYKNGDNWCETDWVEPMDRIAETDTVAVWGYCYADEIETVFEAIEMWTNDWANEYGFELRITPVPMD